MAVDRRHVPWRRVRVAAVLLAGALALAACNQADRTEKPPLPGDRPVARVDGLTVWTSDVKREAVAQGLIGESEPLDVSSDLFRKVMDEVVDQKLLAAEALKRKLDQDPLAQRRLAAARERVLGDMLVESVVAGAANENAIRGLYQEQLRLAKPSEEIHARQLVLATAPEIDAARKLLAAGASFEALATERSIDAATRLNGGDLGYFTTDVMPEAYGAALKDAKAGDIVGPFEVDGGYALLKVEDRRPEAPVTLEAARPQIVRFLTYDQIRDLIEKLRGAAKVQSLIPPPVRSQPAAPVQPPPVGPSIAPPAPAPAPAPVTAAPAAKPAPVQSPAKTAKP